MALTSPSGISADKITGQPVYKPPSRACREWVQQMKEQPEGFRAFKFNIDQAFPIERPYHPTLTTTELRKLNPAFANVREAAGDTFDLGVACHGEFGTPSAIAINQTVEPLGVLFVEDALNAPYSNGWLAYRRASRVPVLTGEKLEHLRDFKPFLDNQAADIMHPDVSFAGSITGVRKIADCAAITRTPVALHNVGTLVRTYASAHLSLAMQNFYRSESWLGRPGRLREEMNSDFLRRQLKQGEVWWA